MTLKEDVNAALHELGQHVKFEVPSLDDKGASRLVIQVPPALHALRDGELMIDIQLSSMGDRFSLLTPIAAFTNPPNRDVLEALLRRQFAGGQSSGLSYAIRTVDDQYYTLFAIAHWILGSITPQQFQQFYQRFMAAAFMVLDDIAEIGQLTPDIEAFHPGKS